MFASRLLKRRKRAVVIEISGRKIGLDHPPFIIAEMSGNHNQSLDRALEIVEAAAKTGAHALKIQTYTPDTMTIDLNEREFHISDSKSLWAGKSLYHLYGEAYTPWKWHKPIFDRAAKLGLIPFSTPFDDTAVDFLENLDVPCYKIASFENTDLPLIRRVAATGKPLIISTGMANFAEIGEAVAAARGAGCRELALLHCVSAYPAPAADANLRTIAHLGQSFDAAAGLSDHTLGTAVAVAAVAAGASLIEKHVTLRRADGGPDAAFSLEPAELAQLVRDCRSAFAALGRVSYDRAPSEQGNAVFRRSLYVVRSMAAGEPFTRETVRSIRPGYGLPPKHLPEVIGRRAARALERGTALEWSMIDRKESR